MHVRLKEGRNAGQIVDMPYHYAKPLIDQGRAIDMRDESQAEPLVAFGPMVPTEPVKTQELPGIVPGATPVQELTRRGKSAK